MYKTLSIVIVLISACFSGAIAQEKPREFSPYSRFGIGDLADPHFGAVSHLGGIAAAFTDRNQLNADNPASLGALRSTAFEGGVSTKYTTLSSGDQRTRFFGGGLDYLALGLPLYNPINDLLNRNRRNLHIGTMFVLKPYSFVGYDISQIDSIAGTGSYQRKYIGNGGTYEFKWSNGFEYKQFSGGIGLGYLFGKMTYKRELDLLSVPLPYTTIFLNEISMRGVKWNAGIQYKVNLKKLAEGEVESSRYLSVGIYGQSAQDFKTTSNEIYRRELIVTSTAGIVDTVRNVTDQPGTGVLPGEIHAGFYYNDKYKLQFGGQYSLVSWSKYKNSAKPEILQNASHISFGAAYCPDIESLDNFLKRVTYRVGFRFGNDPRSFQNEQVKDFSVTFGAGVPFVYQRKVSFVNFAVEMGNIGLKDNLKSKYVQLKLGFTLNDDEWFLKSKYN